MRAARNLRSRREVAINYRNPRYHPISSLPIGHTNRINPQDTFPHSADRYNMLNILLFFFFILQIVYRKLAFTLRISTNRA